MRIPRYRELPVNASGHRSAWSLFGADDSAGLLNLQTSDSVLDAIQCARKGAVFPLNAPIDIIDPPFFGRAAAAHRIVTSPPHTDLDDVLDNFYPQAASQWDALAHAAYGPDAFYNGARLADVLERGQNTIDHWARRGIVARAVILDIEALLRKADPAYSPAAPVPISSGHLEEARRAADVAYRPGDVLVVNTGFLAWYIRQPGAVRAGLAEGRLQAAGLDHCEDVVEYLWDAHVSAVVSENPAVEVCPPDDTASSWPFGYLHRMLIGQLGMAIGELWWLADLVADCRLDGRYTALLTSAPLHVTGGVGSPSNALAIK